jgi:nucleoside-diphosphate-sugar epimerase
VHVSSPSVAHAGSSLVGVGAGPADPDRARGAYARSKAAAEQIALAADGADLAVTAIRPHLVWGPGDQQLIGRILERARAGRLPLIGTGAALMDSTYTDNAVTALLAAVDRTEAAAGRALVVSNGEPRPVAELFAAICAAAGVPGPRRRVPAGLAYAAGLVAEGVGRARKVEPPMTRFLAEQLATAHWFDQRETRAVLAWTPEVSLDEGFVRLAAAFRP